MIERDVKETDIAWCAGFFDGEGHVSCHRSYPNPKTGRVSPQLYANVPQTADNVEVLEFFRSVIGFGRIKGPYKTKLGRDKCALLFGVKEVEPLFAMLRPYLRADKTLAFQRALMNYWSFDHNATAEDYMRISKRDKKKGMMR